MHDSASTFNFNLAGTMFSFSHTHLTSIMTLTCSCHLAIHLFGSSCSILSSNAAAQVVFLLVSHKGLTYGVNMIRKEQSQPEVLYRLASFHLFDLLTRLCVSYKRGRQNIWGEHDNLSRFTGKLCLTHMHVLKSPKHGRRSNLSLISAPSCVIVMFVVGSLYVQGRDHNHK